MIGWIDKEEWDTLKEYRKEKHSEFLTTCENSTVVLILKAHDNLTTKKGRPDYAPDVHEMQAEINKIIADEK